ncbi:MAG: glycosyltransferase family 39 protein [Candidatus Bathyarchaeota archaeon]|nr:glycosyltransferase family 39 protein [Candidatus Bathyarchaeota archaeon]
MSNMLDKQTLAGWLRENYPLIAILLGAMMLSFSVGPYENGDTIWEFKAASGVIQWGMPYVEVQGSLMNQPPLGFYLQGFFLKLFGMSVSTGVLLVTLLGISSTFLMYKIGKELYGKPAGLLAAALFGFTPWQLVLSRSFLIDVPCLFFTLVCLFFAILAIHRCSIKLATLSGLFFAAALLTKLFAIFILVPIVLLYVYYHPETPRRIISQVGLFCLPVLSFSYLWYQVILGKNLFYLFSHNDFFEINLQTNQPTYFFVSNFLLNYGLGTIFIAAAIFSVLLSLIFRRRLSRFLTMDVICLVTICTICGVNTFMGASLNLNVPYTSAIKYDYQSLPFFSLLAASLAGKCSVLLRKNPLKTRGDQLLFVSGLAGVFLLVASVFSIQFITLDSSRLNFLKYSVQSGSIQGYALSASTPLLQYSFSMFVQYLGCTIVLAALLVANKSYLKSMFKPMHSWIETKNSAFKNNNRPLI